MAKKRMFSKEITTDGKFTDMSSSAQALYFHLGMLADDDGFVNNPKMAMTMAHASDDDMRVLNAKNYIIFIREGLVVITEWKLNNNIQKDRYVPTRYQEEMSLLVINQGRYYLKEISLLDGLDTKCIQSVSIDKDKDKNRLDKNENEMNNNACTHDSNIINEPLSITDEETLKRLKEIAKTPWINND